LWIFLLILTCNFPSSRTEEKQEAMNVMVQIIQLCWASKHLGKCILGNDFILSALEMQVFNMLTSAQLYSEVQENSEDVSSRTDLMDVAVEAYYKLPLIVQAHTEPENWSIDPEKS
jgi:hypothetical protein